MPKLMAVKVSFLPTDSHTNKCALQNSVWQSSCVPQESLLQQHSTLHSLISVHIIQCENESRHYSYPLLALLNTFTGTISRVLTIQTASNQHPPQHSLLTSKRPTACPDISEKNTTPLRHLTGHRGSTINKSSSNPQHFNSTEHQPSFLQPPG